MTKAKNEGVWGRRARLDYLREWKETARPSPLPLENADRELPSRGIIVFSRDGRKVQCHACGEWFGSLNLHLSRRHGMNAALYKELFHLKRTSSLWPPALKKKQRKSALDRGQGDIGREHLPRNAKRPKGLRHRLQTKIEASEQRKGVYTRGGQKTDWSI